MIFQIVAAVIILMYFAAPCTADMLVFGWNDNGTYSFTDDWKKVPTAYKDIVGTAEVDGLENYEKFTKDETDEEKE
jgi:hypothetical protein